jgi:two-component system nitrate/nitrite response regulator NarL
VIAARRRAARVVVADVRPVIAQGLAAALTADRRLEAAAASTDTELIAAIRSRTPDVVLVPLDGDGHAPGLLRCALRAVPAGTDVVVVGSPGPVAGSSRPWTADGVRAVLPATSTVEELADGIAAVRARLNAAGAAPAVPTARMTGHPEPEGPTARDDALARLTAREQEVLGLLAQGRSTREIADQMSVSVNTVRAHVNVLLHKLGVHSRLRAVALFTDGAPSPAAADGGPAEG